MPIAMDAAVEKGRLPVNDAALSLTVRVSELAYRRFAFFDGFLLPRQWAKLIVFFILMLALALANLLTGATTLFWALLMIGLLSPGAYLAQFAYTVSQQLKRFRLDPAQSAYTLTFPAREEVFTLAAEGQEPRRTRWSQLTGAYRRRTAVYLYTGKGQVILIPLEPLGAGEAERLWTLVETHLPKDRRHVQGGVRP